MRALRKLVSVFRTMPEQYPLHGKFTSALTATLILLRRFSASVYAKFEAAMSFA